MSTNDLINLWDQTISKWPFSGHFEFCNIDLTQEMQNDWTMNIEQNVMSHTRITHDKFHTKKSKMAAIRPFFFTISEILHDSWSMNFRFLILHKNSCRAITEGCFRVRFRTTLSSLFCIWGTVYVKMYSVTRRGMAPPIIGGTLSGTPPPKKKIRISKVCRHRQLLPLCKQALSGIVS